MGVPTLQQLYWYDNRKFGSTPLSHSCHCKGGLCVAMGFSRNADMGAPTVQQLYWYDNKFGSTPLSHSCHCKGGLYVAMGFFEECGYGGSYSTTAVLV